MESRLERCSLKEAGISASGVQKFLETRSRPEATTFTA